MISYRIISKRPVNSIKAEIKALPPTDPKFRHFVLDKQLKANRLQVGQKVKIRGTNKCGEITEILTTVEEAQWKNNSPYFIVVKVHPTNDEFVAAPRQLKRRR